MSKSGGDTSTVSTMEPWTQQQPYLQEGYAQALGNLQNPQQFFPGATYNPFSAQTQTGIDMLSNPRSNPLNPYVQQALGGDSPVQGLVQQGVGGMDPNQGLSFLQGSTPTSGALQDTAGGNYLNSNPNLRGMLDEASRGVRENWQDTVLPGINATFGGAGRTGSPAQQQAIADSTGQLSDSLAGMSSNIYGSNYARERGLQQDAASRLASLGLGQGSQALSLDPQARQRALSGAGTLGSYLGQSASLAPTAQALDQANISNMLQAGGAVDQKALEALQDQMSRFQFGQQEPDMALGRYINAIQGNPGSVQNQQTDVNGNPIAGGIGGALAGFGLGQELGWGQPGWGALGGGILGALGGLL